MEEKKERRNRRIVIIAAMLALLIAIVTFAGTTFAKYVSKSSVDTTSATVAKWGFIVKADAREMFSEAYKNNVQTNRNETGVDVSVASGADSNAKLVAPGTSGKLVFGVEGQAEVMAKIVMAVKEADVKDITLSAKKGAAAEKTYNPIVWKLKTADTEAGLSADDAKELNSTDDALLDGTLLGIAKYLNKQYPETGATTIAPNQEVTGKYYELSWSWAFETTTGGGKDVNNVYDTVLGYAAAFKADNTKTAFGNYTIAAGTGDAAGKIIVTDTNGTTAGENATDDDIVYTVTVEVAFNLSLSVEQVRNVA